ncbi:MAG: hypothetical protein FWE67_07640 [Planctomycetaceae bacterium]|nr:hypothetical protein [Planctomycetaceae bacterium]
MQIGGLRGETNRNGSISEGKNFLDISNEISFHLSRLKELCTEVAAVDSAFTESGSRFTENNSRTNASPVRRRRTKAELRILIEAAVDTLGAETTDKEIAENTGIKPSMLCREPYSTYLSNARKEYEKKQQAELAVERNKRRYKDG